MTVTGTRFPLANQHVMVVGGSCGIGFATARHANLAGAQVTFVARKQDRLREVAESLCGARVLVADLHDPAAISNLLQDTPPIDHLVVTDGTAHSQPLKDTTAEELKRNVTERLIRPLWLIKSAMSHLRQTSSVTLTSAQLASRSLGVGDVMAGAIAATDTIGRALAMELWPVRVNVVAPGVTDTSLLDTLLGLEEKPISDGVIAALPARPMTTIDEVAQAVLFLMSTSSVTGEVLHVDGNGRWAGNSGALGDLASRACSMAC